MNNKKIGTSKRVVKEEKTDLQKIVSIITNKTSRMMNYGDELLPEDKEPGFILDESRN
jgi:hypothetical protein